MDNVIIHIPHSSVYIPKEFLNSFLISKDKLKNELNIMTDLYTDKLINKDNNIIKFKFSRLLCDVERFNNESEIMNKIGMGVSYTKTHNLNPLKVIDNINYINKIYDNHHNELLELVNNKLEKYNKVIIIDIHSYSEFPLRYEMKINKNYNLRPDICIGFDDYHINKDILNLVTNYLDDTYYTYTYNNPFKGSIVPIEYYKNNKNIISIMLEINKRLYINSDYTINKKDFYELKKHINNLIYKIKQNN